MRRAVDGRIVRAAAHLVAIALVGTLVGAIGCTPAAPDRALPRELAPVPDSLPDDDPLYAPQPHRDRPAGIVWDAARDRLWVLLQGTESEPGNEVAVLDATTLAVRRRVRVGPFPCALALHPAGAHLVVLNRFARYASVIDLAREEVVGEVGTPYFSESIAFSSDGARAWIANRWRDALLRWDVRVEGDRLLVDPEDDGTLAWREPSLRTLANPRRVVATGDGRLIVTSESALAVAVHDADTGARLAEHSPNAPVIDALAIGEHVVILHTGQGSGHPPASGLDGDEDGAPGDGTANVVFQDLQNEVDVLAARDLALEHRYTSDSICCRDYRDVDPDRPEAGLELPGGDRWPPERAAFLPPRETWIVAGAMPERAIEIRRADGTPAVAVVYGGSSEVQTFDLDPSTGALAPRERAGSLFSTGLGAMDAVAIHGGTELVVVDRLGESLTRIDLEGGGSERVVIGDESGGAFPATDAELGEAFNTVTAPFTIDGDQTCVHCHRDGSPIGKGVSMPLLVDPAFGTRSVMSYRGASDTRPWFLEAGMDDGNFFPVINEFARRENFCCEGTDPRVFGALPTRAQCEAAPETEGCDHVMRCTESPPPACAERAYGSPHLTRDRHFLDAARRVLGRDTTIGDVIYSERLAPDGTIERRPIPLSFDGITRALGVFLRTRTRLLPNPNETAPTADVALGEAIYASSDAGCSTCHPLPLAATAVGSDFDAPLSMTYVISPLRNPETGADVDVITPGFLQTFPRATQTAAGLRVGVTSLRGAWDRTRFFHHAQARSLVEALATPGHPALVPGQRGWNERDGQPDTHGGTSHLTPDELRALAAFVESL